VAVRLPTPRGPLSRWCIARLTGGDRPHGSATPPVDASVDTLADDDAQLALWLLYELHYRGLDDVDPALEWDPGLLAFRGELEQVLEAQLREWTAPVVAETQACGGDVAELIFRLCAHDDSPAAASYVHRFGDREQLLELLAHRSVYQLKEADPQTWMLPRLHGRAKAALVQVQFDEYGCGRADDVHQELFADTLAACGLRPEYAGYVEQAPGCTLALSNTVSMFGLHRRLLGAAAGHFAAVEATSSQPSRRLARAVRRAGFGDAAARFFDEHVEADAVHEQMIARELCGTLVEEQPRLRREVLFGAAACLLAEGRFSETVVRAWTAGQSSLYPPAMTAGVPAARSAAP
jgi:hypothetical protein